MNLRRMGTVRDYSCWRGCEEDPNVTLYSKRVDFDIRMPVGPTIMMQVIYSLSPAVKAFAFVVLPGRTSSYVLCINSSYMYIYVRASILAIASEGKTPSPPPNTFLS